MIETPLTEDVALRMLREWRPNDAAERMKLANYHRLRQSTNGMFLPEPLPDAPYEVGAELRMLRAGWPGDDIREFLKLRATKLMKRLNDQMTWEQDAHNQGRVVYDSPIKAG